MCQIILYKISCVTQEIKKNERYLLMKLSIRLRASHYTLLNLFFNIL